MSEWKTVDCNSNLIQHVTDKAVLIKLPKSDFQFWHPSKCCRQSGKGNYKLTISYTDTFSFNIFKPGKGKWNKRDKIEEKTLTAAEFESYFSPIA